METDQIRSPARNTIRNTEVEQSPRRLMLLMNEDPELFSFVPKLKDLGWEVSLCGDAIGAQSTARKEQPSMILVGEKLPGGGPAAAINRLKRNVHTASIAIFGVGSANAEAFADVDGCLSPDMDVHEMNQLIEAHLGCESVPLTAPAEVINDPGRLSTLRATKLLDAGFDAEIDALTEIAAGLVDAPVALLSLVEHDRQYFKSFVGLDEPWAGQRQTDLPHSFCQWVVSSEEALIVEDARLHPVLSHNLAVQDLGVTAYAGVPVRSPSGHALGSMCAIDSKPRCWTDDEAQLLRFLSSVIEAHSLAVSAELTETERRAAQQATARGIRGSVQLLRRGWTQLAEHQRNQLLTFMDRFSANMVALTV